MNFALIRSGTVYNIIVADNDAEFLENVRILHNCDEIVEAKENCEIGGTYANGIFVRKPVDAIVVETTEEQQ